AFAFTPGLEMFRTAKEAVFRAQALLMAFGVAAAVAFGGTERLRAMLRDRAVVIILAGVLLWSAISTAASGNRMVSFEAFATIVCSLLLFTAVWYIAPRFPMAALLVLVATALVNVSLATLQEYGIWNPFEFSQQQLLPAHLTATALIGNPNDVGGYLALCTVVLFAASRSLAGRLRALALFGGVIALAGVLVSQTRTAILALAITAVFIALRRSRKLALGVAAVLLVTLIVAWFVNLGVVSRLAHLPEYVAEGHWNVVLSDRLPAFTAAAAMFADHPLLGVGPGAYKFFYLSYRIRLVQTYPESIMGSAGVNFAEVHNDHLQLLAETGLPGYALFVAACVVVAMRARRSEDANEQARLAARLALPLVITVAMMALAFFPLQIASTRHLLITVAALIAGWSRT
ncbi:MAG TPA: O-antigen ligase family protein, partial [Thermoanaerobaculia bacterium]|nr:O-antigen ligase family protein [Thermoanaerobaculia bacterium]